MKRMQWILAAIAFGLPTLGCGAHDDQGMEPPTEAAAGLEQQLPDCKSIEIAAERSSIETTLVAGSTEQAIVSVDGVPQCAVTVAPDSEQVDAPTRLSESDSPKLASESGSPILLSESESTTLLSQSGSTEGGGTLAGCFCVTEYEYWCQDGGWSGLLWKRPVSYECCPYGCCWYQCSVTWVGNWSLAGLCMP